MKFQEIKSIKDYILSHVTEEAIFSYYLDIPISDIIDATNKPSNKVKNKHRFETDGSVTFTYTNKLKMKDYGDNRWNGDCFHVAGLVLRKNCNDPRDFMFILNDIVEHVVKQNTKFLATDTPIITHKPLIKLDTIEISNRDFTKFDYDYFFQYNLKKESLKNIFVIQNYWLDKVLNKYEYTKHDPCYAYYLGKSNNRILWKLYFPLRKKKEVRFITNNYYPIENIEEIKENRILIITKSQKDKRLLKQIFKDLHITIVDVINISSESVHIPDDIVKYIKSKYTIVTSLYDNDKSGIEASNNLAATQNIYPFFLWGRQKLSTKDITDTSKEYGYKTVIELIESAYINLINN